MARKDPTKTVDVRHAEGWHEVHWSDGTEQWCIHPPTPALLYVERVIRPNSRLGSERARQVKWYVVDRRAPARALAVHLPQFTPFTLPGYNTSMYPVRIAGPFENLDGAKVALKILLTTGEKS